MIKDKTKPPKIRHKSKDETKVAQRLTGVLRKALTPKVERALSLIVSEVGSPRWDGDGKDLLEWRKRLAAMIKEGMLERKDREIEIIALALLVWWNRQRHEERMRLITW